MQQHGRKHFTGNGVKIQLQNTVMLHIKLKGGSSMVANILFADPYPTPLGLGSIGYHSTISEHVHECSNLVKPTAIYRQTLNLEFVRRYAAIHHPIFPRPKPLEKLWGNITFFLYIWILTSTLPSLNFCDLLHEG